MQKIVEDAIKHYLERDRSETKKLVDAFVDQAVEITKSEMGYFAVMNKAEDVLTMLGWSNSAMANCSMIDQPIVYPVEQTGLWGDAVRERQPAITNDYANSEKLTKKGYPEGHVTVVRHVNIPIWDGTHIAGVLGVGNKATDYTDEDVQAMTDYAQGIWGMLKMELQKLVGIDM